MSGLTPSRASSAPTGSAFATYFVPYPNPLSLDGLTRDCGYQPMALHINGNAAPRPWSRSRAGTGLQAPGSRLWRADPPVCGTAPATASGTGAPVARPRCDAVPVLLPAPADSRHGH